MSVRTAPTAIDLFCGAGGLSSGLTQAGFRVLGAIDAWDKAIETYRLNFDHPALMADLREMTGADLRKQFGCGSRQVIDLVAGGPPCQGFSIQRIGDDADSRNDLVLVFGRLVRELGARAFLMENVPGLLGKRGRTLMDRFKREMVAGGYDVFYECLNTADFGIPQVRKRVVCCGFLAGGPPFAFPVPTVAQHVTVAEALDDLPSPPSDHSTPPNDPLHRRIRFSPRNQQRIEMVPPGGGFEDLPVEARVDCHKQGAARIGHRNVYGRLHPDRPAVTITARFDSFTRGKFGHHREPRNITLREGARLQSFADDFKFQGIQEVVAALIGNAVPPMMAKVLGQAIAKRLRAAPKATDRKQQRQLDLFASSSRA